jgi:hydrogenase maturation protease
LLQRRIAVIGIGNTLRRDDGIGIIVLESLLNFYKRTDIDYFNFGSASFDLLHRIKTYDAVLLIDGVDAGLNIGELRISKLEDMDYKLKKAASSTHELNLNNILELSKDLGIRVEIYLAGIQVGDISFGEVLSATLNLKKEAITKEIATFIDKRFQ